MMSKNVIYVTLVTVFLVLLFVFSSRNSRENSTENQELDNNKTPVHSNIVNVYSARKEELIKDLFNVFTRKYNIKVNYIIDDPSKLIARILNEGKNTQADVLLTSDVVNLILAEKNGILEKIESQILEESIPEHLRNGYWFALTKRARLLVYAKDKIDVSELNDYEDLADPKWRDRVLMRSSNHPYNQSLLASIIAADGEEQARNWVKGIVRNLARPPYGGDTDQIRAVAAGEGDITIANSYYVARILSSKNKSSQKVASRIGIFFPNQTNRGTMVNISGGGVIKYSKNKYNAQLLLEFMISPEAQIMYTTKNYEYPILESVKMSNILERWGDYKSDEKSLKDLMQYMSLAIQIADEEGWK